MADKEKTFFEKWWDSLEEFEHPFSYELKFGEEGVRNYKQLMKEINENPRCINDC